MLHPNQFQVNEAWIVFKLNDAPVATEQDGDFNVMTLMDAASCYILEMQFVSALSAEMSQLESRRLLNGGHAKSNVYPAKLLLSDDQVAEALVGEAGTLNIDVMHVPSEQLSIFIDEAREGFREHIGGNQLN